jgi:hypothetical protein
MAMVGSCGRKFAQLVTDHILGDVHGYKFFSIVNGERQADHVRNDHGPSRPCFDNLAAIVVHCFSDLSHQTFINKGAFFN